ncbi:mitochondrial carrier domain-containing protein [Tuber borchii]|uniref:Mitochondrial carrier domain-containing protein n=1 Tax=Tuber borchii TaxID=42251 RepID=A0A2T6ZZ24_TUBBO|nr:mitochondrial carrier domain-containing protein [Tuber borchii]
MGAPQAVPIDRQHVFDTPTAPEHSPYRGFVAGVFSGATKLTVGHPFDTIKVRMQTSTSAKFKGPLDCLTTTVGKEGLRGLYKGATPPLVGWMFMDSIMLGSLANYRAAIKSKFYPNHDTLPSFGHGMAGILSGWTVSLIAAPVEHVKARLQTQYNAKGSKAGVKYSGPIDCTRKLLSNHGIQGLYHGLGATMIGRTFFFFMWTSYDIMTRQLEQRTNMSPMLVNFWAGGLSANVYWLLCYPSDVIKQRIMTDSLENRKFKNWREAAVAVGRQSGVRGYYRGFLPCIMRAFPANAAALVAFEGVMRHLP